jgi:phosphate transport system protein
MPTYLEQELEDIKLKIFEMADHSMEAISRAMQALEKGDVSLAARIIEEDSVIDRLEVELDEECVKVLVTRQPAAVDLRLVLSIIKMNTDLERIGDLATNIARETIRLDGKKPVKPLVDIPRMASLCMGMIRDSLRAFAEKNADLARDIISRDSEIDDLNLQVYRELFSYMAENPRVISQSLSLIMISKALERIGDHATNIAERAIYYIRGEDVRHAV